MLKKDKEAGLIKDGEEPKDVYKISWFDRIPYWIKAVFLQYWMFGAIYFFIGFGSGSFLSNSTIAWLVYALAYAIVWDYIVYHILHLFDSSAEESKFYTLYHSRKWYSIVINLALGLVWSLLQLLTCAGLVDLFNSRYLFREPFSQALIGLMYQFMFVGIKNGIRYLWRKYFEKREVA